VDPKFERTIQMKSVKQTRIS